MTHPTIDSSWYQRSPGVPEETSAGGVVVRGGRDRLFVALVREGTLPTYVLPKGRLEAGESLEQAAQREILEEAGLSHLTLLCKLGVQERLSYSKKSWKIIHYFLFLTDQEQGNPTDPHRAYQLYWFPLNDLPEMFWVEQKDLIEHHRDEIFTAVTQRLREEI